MFFGQIDILRNKNERINVPYLYGWKIGLEVRRKIKEKKKMIERQKNNEKLMELKNMKNEFERIVEPNKPKPKNSLLEL